MAHHTDASSSVDRLFKVLVLGVNNAGKTCLIRQYVHKLYQPNIKPTIGVDFALKVTRREDTAITLQIWDIAGQERCGSMTRVYYQSARGALVLYDCTDPYSFAGVLEWKADIDRKLDSQPIPCILVANKCDQKENPERTEEELNAFVAQHGFAGWVRTSARTNTNVDEAFDMLIKKILENEDYVEAAPTPAGVALPPADARPRGSTCCGKKG